MLAALFRLLSNLPLPILHALGVLIGWLVYCTSPSYRKRLRSHIHNAGYPHILRASIQEAGKSISELPFVWCAPAERVQRSIQIENWDMLQTALDNQEGKGVIILTPHLGCFEIIAQAIAIRTPLTVLYRAPRKSALKPLVEDARARDNLYLAPADLKGVRILAKALKKGQPIGLLPDQVPQEGEGVWANFFNRPAYTMTLPCKLQKISDAIIILSYAERLPHGKGYVVRFMPFETKTHDDKGNELSLQKQVQAINNAMEKLIAYCPAQYFWSYNRYKKPDHAKADDAMEAQ